MGGLRVLTAKASKPLSATNPYKFIYCKKLKSDDIMGMSKLSDGVYLRRYIDSQNPPKRPKDI
ncbi:MAG: hypothetical protein WC292_02200 [Clostridia bacterium]